MLPCLFMHVLTYVRREQLKGKKKNLTKKKRKEKRERRRKNENKKGGKKRLESRRKNVKEMKELR